MSILFMILKVIGIVLLVLIGLILLLVLFALLSPIRYESVGRAGGPDIQVKLTIHWLLRILGIRGIVTADRIALDVRILFLHPLKRSIPWHYPLAPKPEEDVSDEPEAPEEPALEVRVEPVETPHEDAGSKEPYTPSPDDYEDVEFDFEHHEIHPVSEIPKEPDHRQEEEVPEPEMPEDRKDLFEKAEEQIAKIREKAEEQFAKIREKLDPLLEKYRQGRELLERKDIWTTVRLVKRMVFRILRHIRPKNVRIHARMGTGDPATTGEILAAFCAAYPIYANHGDYRLSADFHKKTLSGKYYIKGRIVPAVIVLCGLRLLLNKNIRKLIFR